MEKNERNRKVKKKKNDGMINIEKEKRK